MVVLKRKSQKESNKDDGRQKGDRKKVKYVYLASKKAVFLVTGKPRESKYSYGVPILPLHGYYKSDGKRYTAKELSNYYIILNLDKDDGLIDELEKGKVVVIGYDEKDVLVVEGDTSGSPKED
ncbi:hypothetical protein [Saccharolobus islandicus]|uniref:hypothetical protein n=1 Tax=Saccharolobus islandicus TaxID=43080 RepID=UPI000AE82AFA|nr:hypothetical protein [Sulfolobus islandicus]